MSLLVLCMASPLSHKTINSKSAAVCGVIRRSRKSRKAPGGKVVPQANNIAVSTVLTRKRFTFAQKLVATTHWAVSSSVSAALTGAISWLGLRMRSTTQFQQRAAGRAYNKSRHNRTTQALCWTRHCVPRPCAKRYMQKQYRLKKD